jgi:hypothetical protein
MFCTRAREGHRVMWNPTNTTADGQPVTLADEESWVLDDPKDRIIATKYGGYQTKPTSERRKDVFLDNFADSPSPSPTLRHKSITAESPEPASVAYPSLEQYLGGVAVPAEQENDSTRAMFARYITTDAGQQATNISPIGADAGQATILQAGTIEQDTSGVSTNQMSIIDGNNGQDENQTAYQQENGM